MPTPREVWKMLMRQRSRGWCARGQTNGAPKKTAIAPRQSASVPSRSWPEREWVRRSCAKPHRTRVAGARRDSKCRSLAPLAAAALINDSRSIVSTCFNQHLPRQKVAVKSALGKFSTRLRRIRILPRSFPWLDEPRREPRKTAGQIVRHENLSVAVRPLPMPMVGMEMARDISLATDGATSSSTIANAPIPPAPWRPRPTLAAPRHFCL